MTTGIKGTSSMKLHRDIGVTQKTAWHMAHRIRETFDRGEMTFAGPVEVDETYIGGKEKGTSMRLRTRLNAWTVVRLARRLLSGLRTGKRIRSTRKSRQTLMGRR